MTSIVSYAVKLGNTIQN